MKITFKTGLNYTWEVKEGVKHWDDEIAVDLRWVAAVEPYNRGANSAIVMAGSAMRITVDMPYDELMQLWLADPPPVKGWTDAQTAEMWARADEAAQHAAARCFPAEMVMERNQCRRETAMRLFKDMAFP